jgi:nucleotide-binding universal stress UspA family protein
VRYKKILVAIDRSAQSDSVFEQALELAIKEEASLMLFHCLPSELQGSGLYADMYGRELINYSREMQKQLRKEKEDACEWIAGYYQVATARGVATEWDVKVGDAGSVLLQLAVVWNADLIVLGRRGHRGLAEVFLGSISNYVVHHAPCSVLVVQGITSKTEPPLEAVIQSQN